jgi:hypothetical protein
MVKPINGRNAEDGNNCLGVFLNPYKSANLRLYMIELILLSLFMLLFYVDNRIYKILFIIGIGILLYTMSLNSNIDTLAMQIGLGWECA